MGTYIVKYHDMNRATLIEAVSIHQVPEFQILGL